MSTAQFTSAQTAIILLTRAQFAAQLGSPDLAAAVCGYTRKVDTVTVLTLLCHAHPRHELEIGTALGH